MAAKTASQVLYSILRCRSKASLLYVGDNIAANIDSDLITKATQKKVNFRKAYTATRNTDSNNVKSPEYLALNVTDVIPKEFKSKKYH